MNGARKITIFSGLLLFFGALNGPVLAQTRSDLGDLVGARGSSGETQMHARGYTFVKTVTASNQKWSYWWSQGQGQCVQVATGDGRYAAINTCRRRTVVRPLPLVVIRATTVTQALAVAVPGPSP